MINLHFSKPNAFSPGKTLNPARPAAKKPRLDDGSASVPAIAAAPVEEEMPLPVEETVPVEVEAPEGAEKGHPKKGGKSK